MSLWQRGARWCRPGSAAACAQIDARQQRHARAHLAAPRHPPPQDADARCQLEAAVDEARNTALRALQRLAHVQGLAAAAAATPGYGLASRLLFPALPDLLGDADPDIQLEALRQLPALGAELIAKDASRGVGDAQCLMQMALPLTLHDVEEVRGRMAHAARACMHAAAHALACMLLPPCALLMHAAGRTPRGAAARGRLWLRDL